MRYAALAMGLIWLLGCAAEPEPNPFPAQAQAEFAAACRGGDAFCACSWDQITRQFTAEEWAMAQETLAASGRPDPRIVVISNSCREQTR